MTKRGIIIFVGATGTGKSTSLASITGYRQPKLTKVISLPLKTRSNLYTSIKAVLLPSVKSGIDTDSFEIALKNTLTSGT